MVDKPFPCAAPCGLTGAVHRHAYSTGYFGNVLAFPMRGAKHPNFILRKLNLAVLLAPVIGAVVKALQSVGGSRLPTKMAAVDAFAVAAAMGSVPEVQRARAMLHRADDPMNAMVLPVDPDMGIASFVQCERPKDTFLLVGFERFSNKLMCLRHLGFMDTHLSHVNRRLSSAF